MDIVATYTIEPKHDVALPEDWADVLRPFRGVKIDLASSTDEVGYFVASTENVNKVKTFLSEWYIITEF